MNWFKEHLNLTYVIAWVTFWLLSFIMGVFTGILAPQTPDAIVEMRAYIMGFIILFPISIWVIKTKGRSLWWILLVGWFSPLWLGNKKKEVIGQCLEN